jgi:predicted HicB family RNase H-like nuclease
MTAQLLATRQRVKLQSPIIPVIDIAFLLHNCKSYTGSVEFSEEDAVFHGKVIGIKALISFEGDSVSAITRDFNKAIDEYLHFCVAKGKEPERPFKGSFNVRISSELHRKLAIAASSRGVSLNALVEDAIYGTELVPASFFTHFFMKFLTKLQKKLSASRVLIIFSIYR